MKFFLILLNLICVLSLSAVGQTNLSAASGSKKNEKGRGQFAHIWANPAPAGFVFDRWTGDTTLAQDVFSAHTLVNPLSKNINLTATYKSAPAWTPVAETINGASVLYYIPANHVGIIFRFHGTGGSNQLVLNRVEDRLFADEAVAAGYGIVALNSTDRANAQWNLLAPPNNPDIANIQAVIANFRGRGLITQNEPLFAHGTSNGGTFAAEAAYFLNFRAAAIYISFGINQLMTQTTVPTIFCPAANDDNPNVGQAGVQTAYNQFLNLQSRNVRASYNVHPASPVYPERFWRIPGLTQANSQTIYNSLKTNGFLDGRDYLIQNPNASNWQTAIPAQYNSYLSAISSQLEVCFATHQFYSDYNSRVLRFFNAVL